MANVLPPYSGLAVNGVGLSIHDHQGTQMLIWWFMCRTRTQWTVDISSARQMTGRESHRNSINRVVPIQYVDSEYWGDGSIEVIGDGEVVDPTVIYTYRYDDTCVVNPQSDPNCPGYVMVEIPEPAEYQEEDFTQNEIDRQQTFQDENQEREDFERMKEKEKKKT